MVTGAAPWLARQGAGAITTKMSNAIIIAGMTSTWDGAMCDDIWESLDSGSTWGIILSRLPFPARSNFGIFVRSGKILVSGNKICSTAI